MKSIEEKWKDWSQKADSLLVELKACKEYKKLNDEMLKRIEEIFEEYVKLLREGIKILPFKEKIKMGWKILIARWDNTAFRFKWILIQAYRLMLGLDI